MTQRTLTDNLDGSLTLPLTQGYVTIIDAKDRAIVEARLWHAHVTHRNVYAASRHPTPLYLHRAVLGLATGDRRQVDHIDTDGLNNRRANLRIATHHENQMHSRGNRGSSSEYVGVSFHKSTGRWTAKVGELYIGIYDDEADAARARDAAATEIRGAFALLNFPKEGTP